jgi:hypothetical protein
LLPSSSCAGLISYPIFEKPQQGALAMLFLNLHDHGFVVAEIFLGSLALSARAACGKVAIPAAVPGCLASPRRLDVGDPEPYGRTVDAILRQSVYLLSARVLREGDAHFVARHQGR